jgi:DNA-binding CsgD family transcriptional regulator
MERDMKKINLDLNEIEVLAGRGLTEQEICQCIGISRVTLYRRKRDAAAVEEAIQRGRAKAHAVVANVLFELCKEKNLGAVIWFEKTRYGLRDNTHITHSIEQPVTVEAYDYDSSISVLAPANSEA